MNRDIKKSLKIVGSINPTIVQVQIEDYWPLIYKIIIINKKEIIEKK